MAQRVQHTTKIQCYSGIKFNSQSQQSNLHYLHKINDKFKEVYDSHGEPGPFCAMGYLEDTEDFV